MAPEVQLLIGVIDELRILHVDIARLAWGLSGGVGEAPSYPSRILAENHGGPASAATPSAPVSPELEAQRARDEFLAGVGMPVYVG